MTSEIAHYLLVATDCAMLAADELIEGFQTSYTITSKPGKHNLVTAYDKSSEYLITSRIKKEFPKHSILAEEGGLTDLSSDVTWVIDPLDGTVNFAHGIPIFSISIAVAVKGDIVCGVIYQPITKELFTAQKDQGSFLNGKRLQVSKTDTLENAILATGFPYNVNENPLRCIDQLSSILHKGLPVRRLGSAAIDLAYTAAGRFDAYWEASLEPWDIAAGQLILQEAGGSLTDYHGNNRDFQSKSSVLASNGLLHRQMKQVLQEGL
jgi:myo-inositol-1(or 4)-monophosphatase